MPATTQPRRVITAQPRAPRLPSDWLRATLAGAEGAILSWLSVVVPAIATYVATASAPALGDLSAVGVSRTATTLWLLGHGGTARSVLDEGRISLVPLGLSLLSVLLVYGAARRMRLRTAASGGFAVGGFLLVTVLLLLLAVGDGAQGRALLGAAVVATLGVVPALVRGRVPEPGWLRRARAAPPGWVSAGLRGAGWALIGVLGLAVLAVALAVVQGFAHVREIHEALSPDTVSAVVLVLLQLAYLGTLVVWALAWLAGPGFVVGAGTTYSPTVVETAPLPLVPAFGALPRAGELPLGWVVVLVGLVGAAVGGYLRRRHPQERLGQALAAAAVSACLTAAVTALLVLAGRGAIGPGRMARLGAEPLPVAGAVLAEVGAGALLLALALHPDTHDWVRRATARWLRSLRSRP